MNLLLDILPETEIIGGREYYIDCNFRTCIIFEKVLQSNESSQDKVYDMIDLFFPDKKPRDIKAATDSILKLYCCGEQNPRHQQQKNGNVLLKNQMIYDYEYDAPYIYGAFLTQYRVDLNDIEFLHWWKFQAMFRSLEDHNKIVKIMGYRGANLGEIKNKSERERIAKMKQIYALPQNLSFEDKVAMAGAAFGGM